MVNCINFLMNGISWEVSEVCKILQLNTIVTRKTTYLLTYSKVQSPSWEANWFAASQEIPRISRNPKVHYLSHKRPPPFPILRQPNPVHIPTSDLLEIHLNIIHPSMPRSPQWSLSLRFSHQDPIHPPLLTHTCHMPSPSLPVRLHVIKKSLYDVWFTLCGSSFINTTRRGMWISFTNPVACN